MEINKMPEVLNDFRIYDENSDTLYGVAKIELPDFKSITATIKGVGVGGEIEAPVLGQFESLETKLTHNINDKWNLTMVGGRAVALEARAANQYWDSANNNYVMERYEWLSVAGLNRCPAAPGNQHLQPMLKIRLKRRISSTKSMTKRSWK